MLSHQAIAQLPLEVFLLPRAAGPCPIATAGIGQDENVAGLWIAPVSFQFCHQRRRGRRRRRRKFRGTSPQEHTAAVSLGIVDAIRNADTLGRRNGSHDR